MARHPGRSVSPHRWDDSTRPRAARFPPRVARAIVERDGVCQLQLPGCTVDATEADHIVGWPEAQARGWTVERFNAEDNGQAACHPCHLAKTLAQATAGRARARAARPKARPRRRHPGLRPD